jgi:hypothetical protein
MSILISILFAILTYFLLFKVFFEDLEDFAERLKNFLFFFPIAFVLDYVTNWSPSSNKMSLRVLLWLPSGICAGIILYKLLQ